MDTADLDYDLPLELIAQTPVEPRDAARLLVWRGAGRPLEHRVFRELPDLLDPDDLIVVNTSRVLQARLRARKPTGGGVGGFNWRMGRAVLRTAGLAVEDAQFIPAATAGRLPGLVAGQIDAVALHPEDVFLAKKQKPTLNLLVQLAELMPDYMFNAYGASLDWIARDRTLLRDTAAAMIEANRTAYRDKAKVVPIIVKATEKPQDAVEYAIDVLTRNCVWSVNGGLDPERLHQEAVMMAAKADIREELDRLSAHLASVSELLAAGGAIGRRLDFLAQELGREANTLCAKANDVALSRIGLDLKAVVEQFREQVQNVE